MPTTSSCPLFFHVTFIIACYFYSSTQSRFGPEKGGVHEILAFLLPLNGLTSGNPVLLLQERESKKHSQRHCPGLLSCGVCFCALISLGWNHKTLFPGSREKVALGKIALPKAVCHPPCAQVEEKKDGEGSCTAASAEEGGS